MTADDPVPPPDPSEQTETEYLTLTPDELSVIRRVRARGTDRSLTGRSDFDSVIELSEAEYDLVQRMRRPTRDPADVEASLPPLPPRPADDRTAWEKVKAGFRRYGKWSISSTEWNNWT
jgi:hypothetical protein